MNVVQQLIRRQWPFWLGGLAVALAEILFYARYDNFIVVTTGMAQMFAVPEELFFRWDGVAQAYAPGVHWVIVGALAGAWLVTLLEKESRAWVRYQPSMLIMAFIGGLLFSFGTRLAAGCTTHHFIGGLASMSIASWTVLMVGTPFAFLAFLVMVRFGLGGYYRHQDTLESVRACHGDPDQPSPGYDPGYRPWKNPVQLALVAFLLMFLAIPLGFGLFTDRIQGAVGEIGWSHVLWQVGSGLILGFGIAKSGYGTECAAMAPHAYILSKESYRRMGIPMGTHVMFHALLPLQGLMVSVVVFNLYILASWLLGVGSFPNAAGEQGLYWGHVAGAPFLAMGAVFMIGCEVRTYARLGLGYGTALAALPGFYVGYLPYTFFRDTLDDAFLTQGLLSLHTVAEVGQRFMGGPIGLWNVVYSLLLILLLYLSLDSGRRYLQTSMSKMLLKNTDDLVFPGKAAP